MYIQGVDSLFDLQWNHEVTYGDIYKRSEFEWSHYNFTEADTAMWLRHFEEFEAEAIRLIARHFPIPAYDFVMKCSHAFNILDARGVISVTERTAYIARIRNLAKALAESWIESRQRLSFPLMRNHRKRSEVAIPAVSEKHDPSEKRDFLLEIGSEELPATFVPIGMQQLESHMRSLLQENELPFEHLEVFGTPRRLAVRVTQLAGGTEGKRIERKGPAIAAAFESDGRPSKAGEGFFRSLQFDKPTLSQIERGEIPGLEIRTIKGSGYLFATLEQKGIATRQLLAHNLRKLILGLEFPKKMRWSDLDIEYARPLKWIAALYGNEIIPFVVGDIVSSNLTYGHRQMAPLPLELSNPQEYTDLLRKHSVIADVKERAESIEMQLGKVEHSFNAKVIAKERVMHQVLHLVEYPFITVGNFDKKYLQTPKEVSISEMVEHQKYFPLADLQGNLIPHFAIVCNNTPSDLIRAGNQKALSPRLSDGMFLYEEDLKIPLSQFNEKLKHLIFQKELGSVWEKVKRVTGLAEILHNYLPICELDILRRAASLCKADLASHLVGEFPELQGTAGKLYALKGGEKEATALAIEEHWMPRGEKAPLPKTPCGVLLSMAEKIDNFLSCFALDLKPTSSSDPYALRRQAIGMLKMLIEGELHLPIYKAFKEGFAIFRKTPYLSDKIKKEIEEREGTILSDLISYFLNRFRTLLHEYGFDKDEVEATLSQGINDPYDIFRKLKALHEFRKTHHDAFLNILELFTRTKKILLSQNPELSPGWISNQLGGTFFDENRYPPVEPTLFKNTTEEQVYATVLSIKKKFHVDLVDRRDPKGRQWKEAFIALAQLHQPVNTLFEHVKIIDDDPSIRTNRLSLLQEIWDLCEELADFSKIQEHTVTR